MHSAAHDGVFGATCCGRGSLAASMPTYRTSMHSKCILIMDRLFSEFLQFSTSRGRLAETIPDQTERDQIIPDLGVLIYKGWTEDAGLADEITR